MKTPLRYQATEVDCGTTSAINALMYLFEREELPPQIIDFVSRATGDCNLGALGYYRGTSAHALAFIAVLSLFGRELLNAFATKGDAAFADGFSAAAKTLVLIMCAKAVFESAVQVLQAHLRGRGETAVVFRIQCATSLLFWIPLFLAVRAFSPGIPAYWLTMLASSALASAALFLTQSRLPSAPRTPRRPRL